MKLLYTRIFYFVLILVFFVFSCVEEVDLTLKTNKSIVIVDATLNDQNVQQFISLKQSIPSEYNITFLSIKNAKVTLIEDDKNIITAVESTEGKYLFPQDFKAKVMSSYRLKFTLSNGNSYSSSNEILREVPEIDKVYYKYEPEGFEFQKVKRPAHALYLDTKDSKDLGDFYYWSWKLFEKQDFCISCDGGMYYKNPAPLGRCIDDNRLKRAGITYDYSCDSPCWEIKYSQDINVMSDIYSNGNPIIGRSLGKIPFYQEKGCLIEIKQQSVSPGGYKYLKLLVEQSQNLGSLADTPPGALIGNIKNDKDPYESVGGYFFVSGSKTKLFWLDRKEPISEKLRPIGLLNGRQFSMEPSGQADLTRPPLAPCVISNSRTSIKPTGWIN